MLFGDLDAADQLLRTLVVHSGLVAVVVVYQADLMMVPNQTGLNLKQFFNVFRSFQFAVVVVLFQRFTFRQNFFSAHKLNLFSFGVLSFIIAGY